MLGSGGGGGGGGDMVVVVIAMVVVFSTVSLSLSLSSFYLLIFSRFTEIPRSRRFVGSKSCQAGGRSARTSNWVGCLKGRFMRARSGHYPRRVYD